MALRSSIQTSWWGLILADHDTEPVELIGGATKVAMGVWLLMPLRSFASSPTFVTLNLLPEWVWGLFLLALGLLHLAALHNGYRPWRKWSALIGCLVWCSFSIVFVWANPPAIGWIMFMSVGLAQMWASVRLGMPS